jgi:hypothetical protein
MHQTLVNRLVKALLSILAAGYLLAFLFIAAARLFYPYELEWIEGAVVREALWVMEGNFLYVPPNPAFVPLSYNPLFFLLSAGLLKILGAGFLGPRLLSSLATLGIFIILYAIVKKETGSRFAGIISAGIYVACYRLTGAWMDLAKTDSLALFLILFAFYISLKYPHRWGMVLSGVIYVLAFYTKQMALPVILALAPISLLVSRGKTALQWLVTCVGGLVVFWGLEQISQGWYSFYTFVTVLHHERIMDWAGFWKAFLPAMWPAFLLALPFVIQLFRRTKPLRWQYPVNSWNILGLAAGLVAASWSIYFKIWTWDNDLMPACLGMALLAGMGTGELARLPSSKPKWSWIIKLAGAFLLVIQFAILFYNPFDQIPGERERQAALGIVQRVRDLPGEVLVYYHGLVSTQAGKENHFHITALGDVLASDLGGNAQSNRRKQAVKQMFDEAVSGQIFDWVVTDQVEANWLPYYLYTDPVIENNGAMYVTTKTSMVPRSVMIKNPVARGGAAPLGDALFDRYFVEGWGEVQPWGRWAVGPASIMQVALERKHDYVLEIKMKPACENGHSSTSDLRLDWNGEALGELALRDCQEQAATFELSAAQIKKDFNSLQFSWGESAPAISSQTNTPLAGARAAIYEIIFRQK